MARLLPRPAFPSRWRRAAIERMDETAVRWRALGVLFVAGGLIVGGSLLLPAAPGAHLLPIAGLAGTAIGFGLVLVSMALRLPGGDRAVSTALGFGSALITLALIFSRDPTSPYSLIYVWVGFDAFYFLPRSTAYLHVASVGAAYALVLAESPSGSVALASRWLLLVGTVGVVSVLTDLLRSRSDLLINRLSQMAQTDALTGVLNRRGFEQRLAGELSRMHRTGGVLSLVVVDLDHFKRVNDRFGHHRGDDALRAFGRLAVDVLRGVDVIGRLGGEEFGFALPDTDQHAAFMVAERLRRQMRDRLADLGLPVTGSFGIASAPVHGTEPEQLMRAADQAMYVAKRLSRDRSVLFSAEVSASFRAPDEEPAARVENVSAVLLLAEMLDLRDSDTASHSRTVAEYAERIAQHLGLGAQEVERIRLAGLLHDVGKLGVPDPILRKPGPLTEQEWAEMRKHPELGARIASGAGLNDISDWIVAHHERPDGRGYPHGLRAAEIPLPARILAVADAFEAMTSDRVYRSGMDRGAALEELKRHAGTQFDPCVVSAFDQVVASADVSG